jgi:phage I-like protein
MKKTIQVLLISSLFLTGCDSVYYTDTEVKELIKKAETHGKLLEESRWLKFHEAKQIKMLKLLDDVIDEKVPMSKAFSEMATLADSRP